MKSPCVGCGKREQNKEAYFLYSCITGCVQLTLYQEALRKGQTLGAPDPGHCLICRDKSDATYCEHCVRRVTEECERILAALATTEPRCPCGAPLYQDGLCVHCFAKKWDEENIPKSAKSRRYKFWFTIKPQPYRFPQYCDFCHKLIEDRVAVKRRKSQLQFYAHISCVEAHREERIS